ncbi:MAG: penicillin-binding protein 2, partial [Alphaproteobacteria bacterium]
MTRRPLRPLAGVIRARRRGENPDLIEAHRRAERLQETRLQERRRAEWRLTLMGFMLLAAFSAATIRMARLALSEPGEPQVTARAAPLSAARADITDRQGRILATNLPTEAVYTQPNMMVDAKAAAEGLARIFPDLDRADLERRLARGRFFWVRQAISPEQKQQVHDLGEPGLQFAPREMRVYPGGAAVAHLIGAVGLRNPEVDAAELRGTAGVELWFDDWLRDPARFADPDRPPEALALSIDLPVQVALRETLLEGIATYSARGGAGVLMDARTGQVVAMVSLPDFDPNLRPKNPRDRLLFNRAAQGLYELGSVFKPFTAALAMERGIAGPDTLIDTTSPFVWNRSRIHDSHRMPREMPLWQVIAKSSNTGSARLALLAGARAQRDLLTRLGLFDPLPLELPEAAQARPIPPERWSEPYVMRVAFGHSIAVTPVH